MEGPPDRGEAESRPPGSAAVFLLLTFLFTWTCWTIVRVAVPIVTPPGRALVLLGTFGPGIVALALTRRREGAAGVRALLARIPPHGAPLSLYAFAVGWFAVLKLAAAALHRLATGAWPDFGDVPWIVIPFAIALSTPVQAGEEIGWRGYALPRLAARLGLASASLVLGAIWAIWHLPLFFVRDTDSFGRSFPLYFLDVVSISVVIAWLWERSGRRLLLPMLLHAAINNTVVVPTRSSPSNVFGLAAPRIAWIIAALLGASALGFLADTIRRDRAAASRRRDHAG